MESWEFLLQREGDVAWLPLESPDVEILEGRYRVVARVAALRGKVEVRITHHALDEIPPVHRVQTRVTNVSPEGLASILPYSRLKPGIWEIACFASPSSEGFPASQSQVVQLQVLPSDSEPLEQPLQSVSLEHESDFSREQRSAQFLPGSNLMPSSSQDFVVANGVGVSPLMSESLPLQLSLDQTSYMAKLGQSFLMSGQIQLDPSCSESMVMSNLFLRVLLRDPQTSAILSELQQPLPLIPFPLPFTCLVYTPFECQTRSILGEVTLHDDEQIFTKCMFTVGTQVEHLLEVIVQEFEEELESEAIAESLTAVGRGIQLPLESEFPPPPPLPRMKFRPPSTTLNLPSLRASTLDKPPLPLPAATQPLTPELITPQSQSLSPTLSAEPELVGTEPREANRSELSSELVEEQPTQLQPQVSEQTSPSPVQVAFQQLNLQNRFWSRLSALAEDRDLSQWMKRATPNPLPDTPFAASESASTQTSQTSQFHDSSDLLRAETEIEATLVERSVIQDLDAQEVVMDDESLNAPSSSMTRRQTSSDPKSDVKSFQSGGALAAVSEDEPIPAPILEISREVIVAGRPVPIQVRLPEGLPRIYVKIWVYDRQFRQIIDGPRWLTEFSPNGLDQIETSVSLEIAYSSLEVQIEAIAVEMQTQRESRKVVIDRPVVQPDAPTLPLESL
ncbi:MAG: hypothetical protein ACRC8A_09615 [Microcoleaceae cyanobacterium]